MNGSAGASLVDFVVKITFLSDWHIGTGAGSGIIDRLVVRDHDDLPYIPAKTLKGIWRDGCERVAHGLDDGGAERPWTRWVDVLFGDQPALHPPEQPVSGAPRPGALKLRPARYDQNLREVLHSFRSHDRVRVLQAFTFLKPGVRIARNSGMALAKHLRFVEMARKGSILEASATLALDLIEGEDARKDIWALLRAGAAMVERLGGKRRRGSGRCTISVEGLDGRPFAELKQALDWLEARKTPAKVSVVSEPGAPMQVPALAANPLAVSRWYRIPLRITTQTPVLVARQTLGNVVVTQDAIPGTMLLSLLGRIVRQKLNINVFPQAAAGNFLVLPATFEIDGARGRPVPLALARHKDRGGFDRNGTIVNLLAEDEPLRVALKSFRTGFVGTTEETGELPRYLPPGFLVRTHNTVNDRYQRPMEDVGGVYSYEALPSGMVLRSELRVSETVLQALQAGMQETGQNWETLLYEIASLGRSREDDYGQVELEAASACEEEITETWDRRNVLFADDRLIVWILTDTLLRGENLSCDPDPVLLIQELQRLLKVETKGVTLTPGPLAPGRPAAVWATIRVDSWQVTWGLPRPSLLGLRAGSCFVFQVDRGMQTPEEFASRLAMVEITGLGDRRAEGFGQVRFNDLLLTSPLREWVPVNEVSEERMEEIVAIDSRATNYPLAQAIERELWRDQIRRAAQRLAARTQKDSHPLGLDLNAQRPSLSQLGGLRQVIAEAGQDLSRVEESPKQAVANGGNDRPEPSQSLSGVKKWLKHAAQKHRGDWPEATVRKLNDLFDHQDRVWEILEADGWPVLTYGGLKALRDSLRFEAIRAVIDACLRAHQRQREAGRFQPQATTPGG